MNKLAFLLAFFFLTLKTTAQTDPLWTMFQQNLIYHNPTLIGSDSLYSRTAHLQNRNQWPEMSGGGHRTLQLLYHQKLGKSRSALGGYFLRDESGKILTRVRIGGIYSYDFKVQEKIALKVGINTYYSVKSLDISQLRFAPPPFGSLDSLPSGSTASFGVFPGVSINYRNFYFGASVDFIREPSFFHLKKANGTTLFFLMPGTI